MNRIWTFFVTHYGGTATLVNVVLILLAATLHWLPSLVLIGLAGALLLAVAIFDRRLKKKHDQSQALRHHTEFINDLLEAGASSLLRATQPPINHMRACIMVPEGQDLVVAYEHGFAPGDLDRSIRIHIGTGCSGQAWEHIKPMVADLSVTPGGGMPAQWGIRESERAKVRPSLKSILSIPVLAGHRNYRLVAILNFDSDNHVDDVKFKEEPIHDIAYSFAKVISSLMGETID